LEKGVKEQFLAGMHISFNYGEERKRIGGGYLTDRGKGPLKEERGQMFQKGLARIKLGYLSDWVV